MKANQSSKSAKDSAVRKGPKSNRNLKRQNQELISRHSLYQKVVVGSVVVNFILLAGLGLMAMGKIEGGEVRIEGLPATLPPERFQGQTRESYQVAQEIPAVLDAIFCYCYCKTEHGHRSLLDCYVVKDAHASICDVCQLEALRAKELWDMDMPATGPGGDGMAIQDISDQIDSEFGS